MMKRLMFMFLVLAGCNHLTVNRDEPVPGSATQKTYRLNSFAWTFVPTRLPPESDMCPNGRVESLEFRMNGLDVLLTAATFGIYVPQRVHVACSGAVQKN